MWTKVPLYELQERMTRFRAELDQSCPEWETAVVVGKINQYYFTGTMQDGLLIVPRDDEAVYWVYRSYERATDESLFPQIKQMNSYREAAQASGALPKTVFLETEKVPLSFFQRLQKYFSFEAFQSLDKQIDRVRAVKSAYELALVRQAGEIHRRVYEECIPSLLKEGMSEVDLALELYAAMVREGHCGVSRFGAFDMEIFLGHMCFGESTIYPSYFHGPGSNYGMSPAVPFIGSRERRLKKGDLVYIDTGCNVDGYHTDKTMTYMYGRELPESVLSLHRECVRIQDEAALMLRPGAIPADIYRTVMQGIDAGFKNNFMGYGNRTFPFLGHGIGLLIDETPVIAEGFNMPLQEGMVIALEPKKGIPNIGMVGIENTFLVTPTGGCCITGKHPGMMPV